MMIGENTRFGERVGHVLVLPGILVLGSLGAGCSQQMPDRAERMTRGYIYYLDGAGGADCSPTGAAA